MARAPGQALLDLASRAEGELLLVAPYIKTAALKRVLDACPPGTSARVVTRWRLDELACGVSDLSVWPLLRERGYTLGLHPSLHAKYYAANAEALVGSANLTGAALGWMPDPNLEILVGLDGGRSVDFEAELGSRTIEVDDDLHDGFERALAAFPPPPPPPAGEARAGHFQSWRPALRNPADLAVAYDGRVDELTTASRVAAEDDLRALDVPAGFDRGQLEAWVGVQLRQHPEVVAIDRLAREPRRFGEMRRLLAERGAEDGGRAWQTWMRWLLHFLPDHYSMEVANYSEIFSRIGIRRAGRGTGS